jgi:hypothetical protein
VDIDIAQQIANRLGLQLQVVNSVFDTIILAVTSFFTTFQRIYYVWRVTGGEAGGWQPVKEPFVIPATPAPAEQPEAVESADGQIDESESERSSDPASEH